MWNFGCNKLNWYSGTWALHDNYWKDSSPNYMFVNEMELPYLMAYFGDDRSFTIINNILANFDYEAEKERMEKWGYHNALYSWTRPAVVWEDGHTWTDTKGHLTVGHVMCIPVREYGVDTYDFRGNGKGVTVPVDYVKRGGTESMLLPDELINYTFEKCFAKTSKTRIAIKESDLVCGPKDNLTSPYEGMDGMMTEFDAMDMNTRSSLFHCSLDFVLATYAIATLKMLNVIDLTKTPVWDKIKVGMEDYLFKKENGYIGYSMGRVEPNDPVDITLAKEYWINHYR
jgi:hypothetical protein